MNYTGTVVRAGVRRADSFFGSWLIAFAAGIFLGLLAARASCAAIGDTLLLFCSDVCPDGYPAALPLFLSAVLFCLVTVLLSQLPGSACWITLLAGFKAFCTAFVFGVFYVLQQQTDLGPAVLAFSIHMLLLFPAFYYLASHCQGLRLSGSGRYWFRYRVLPVLLTFGYLLLSFWLESALFERL